MPKMPIRKAKRVGVLTKRTQRLRKNYNIRSYRPLYEKLKSNNSYLAKALSKEKQTNQSLFAQNVELLGENQQLNLACNTRSTVITNVLNNSREVLKTLVTMSGYMTDIISTCQELATSNTAMRLSSASAGVKDSSNTLSIKSPAKGVVKPMVGGHTITKPTINLSRVNMESINNISRLSDIQEETTSTRSQEMNEDRSSLIPLPTTPLRYENGRTCRLPERLTISSPRVNDTFATVDQQSLRRKRRSHSKRLSVSFTRSRNRWSETDETPTNTGHIDVIGTRIDIESTDDPSHDLSDGVNTPELQMSVNSNEETKVRAHITKRHPNVQINRKTSNKDFSANSGGTQNSKLSQNSTRTWMEQDPLEGPSWLFNNTMPPLDTEPEELDVSDVNNNTSQILAYDSNVTENNVGETSNLNESANDAQTSERDAAPITERSECESYLHEQDDSNICEMLPTVTVSNRGRNLDNTDDSNANDTMKFASFVTLRQGHSEAPEEPEEDFTLMLRQSTQKVQFNINELRLPVLEESMINDSTVSKKINTEVTATIPKVTNIPMASVSNRSLNKSDYSHITIKMPLILINDHNATPQKMQHFDKRRKKLRTPYTKSQTSCTENSSVDNDATRSINKSENNQDPSSAKVVLEKLNESHVKPKVSSANDTQSDTQRYSSNVTKDAASDEEKSVHDSDGATYASSRPRRRKAPVNLKEPKLNKKLRRNY